MKKWSKLLIAVLLVVCVISPIFTTASCEINDMYSPSDPDNSYWGEDMNDNWLLRKLAEFVYVLAGLVEHLITNLFAMMSGTVDFPWADKIIFNSVAILDVNFISPAAGSYMASAQVYIQRIYYTMFTIALSLFGVLVLITAIKLAISTIASDKAKYKQALTSWVLGFVMLWTIHFLMAFLFYLNEQLVIEASNMAKTALERGNDVLTEYANEELEMARRLLDDDFRSYLTGELITKDMADALYTKYEDAYVYFYITTQTTGTYNVGLRGLLNSMPYHKSLGMNLSNWRYKEASQKKIIQDFTAILHYLNSNTNGLSNVYDSLTSSLQNSFYVQQEGTLDNFAAGNKYVAYSPYPSNGLVQKIIDTADSKASIKLEKVDKSLDRMLFSKVIFKYKIDNEDNIKRIKLDEKIASIHNYNFIHNPEWSDFLSLGNDTWQDWLIQFVVPFPGRQFLVKTIIDKLSDKTVISLSKAGWADTDKLYNTNIYGLPGSLNENLDMQIEYFDDFLNSEEKAYYMAIVSHDDAKDVEWTSPACVIADLREIVKIVKEESSGLERRVSFIDNLAKYFKRFSHETLIANNKLVKGNPIIANQIMYAILVVQSIMLLIAYIKRLFYVLLLSMLAPLVVVVDFFQKFGK